MSRILEIQTDFASKGDWSDEWLVVDAGTHYVHVGREYVSPRDGAGGQRKSWQDQGVSLDYEQLPAFIEAFQRALLMKGSASDPETR